MERGNTKKKLGDKVSLDHPQHKIYPLFFWLGYHKYSYRQWHTNLFLSLFKVHYGYGKYISWLVWRKFSLTYCG